MDQFWPLFWLKRIESKPDKNTLQPNNRLTGDSSDLPCGKIANSKWSVSSEILSSEIKCLYLLKYFIGFARMHTAAVFYTLASIHTREGCSAMKLQFYSAVVRSPSLLCWKICEKCQQIFTLFIARYMSSHV